MPGWRLDADAFKRDVIEATRQGWNPGDNLFRVYQLRLDTVDEPEIAAALDGVRRHLASLNTARDVADVLATRHLSAAELLLDPRARQAHREQVRLLYEGLVEDLRHLLRGAPGVPGEVLAQKESDSWPTVSRRELQEALQRAGGRVREPAELPPVAAPPGWGTLIKKVGAMPAGSPGPRAVWAYLCRWSSPPDRAAGPAELRARQETLAKGRAPGDVAERDLIAILLDRMAGGGLPDLLRFETVEALRSQACLGWSALLRLCRDLAVDLQDLGLIRPGPGDPVEELAYAVWCRQIYRGSQQPAWVAEIEAACAGRQLRAAAARLSAAGALPDPWQQRLGQLRAEIQEVERAFHDACALPEDRCEEAAGILESLLERLADEQIEAALRRCPPPAPTEVHAMADGGDVLISWQPSAARAGRISYLVVRRSGHRPSGPLDGDVVTQTGVQTQARDPAVPLARELFYAVFALRDAGTPTESVSPAGQGQVAAVLPALTDLREVPDPRGIRLTWSLPAAADGALVRRRPAMDPLEAFIASGGDFHDDSAVPGREYGYEVRPRYRDERSRPVEGDPVLVRASRPRPPSPVEDLKAIVTADGLHLRWSQPPDGRVDVLVARTADEVPTGAVAAERIRQVRRLALTEATAGHAVAECPDDLGVFWLFPVTVAGALAAVGTGQQVTGLLPGVKDLQAQVLADEVTLTWQWQGSAQQAVVLRCRDRVPEGIDDPAAAREVVTRGVLQHGRGHQVKGLTRGRWGFAVLTTSMTAGRERYGPPVVATAVVAAQAQFAARRRWWWSRRRIRVVVRWQEPHPLPSLRVVAKDGLRPRNPLDGRLLAIANGGAAQPDVAASQPRARSTQPHVAAAQRDQPAGDCVVPVLLPQDMDHPQINVFADDPTVVLIPASAPARRWPGRGRRLAGVSPWAP